MAKRRKKRRKRTNWFLLLALAVLVAGFLVRRSLMPSAIHYLAYRSPGRPIATPAAAQSPPSEDIDASDRRALDSVVHDKMKK